MAQQDMEGLKGMEIFSCHEIEPNLYLGDSCTLGSCDQLKNLSIERVLSIMNTSIQEFEGIHYKKILVEDSPSEDLLTRFPECIEFIDNGNDYCQNVYVHSLRGTSRSATIVIAFLMHKYKIPYEEARKQVFEKRKISPNKGFIDQLKLFELMNYTIDVDRKEYIDYLARIEEEKGKLKLKITDI